MIDQTDIVSVLLATALGSIMLTPWLSEPLIKACANKLVASGNPSTENIIQPVLVKSRRRWLRIALLTLSMLNS